NPLLDGAAGLTLASETAIGKHAMECINMLNRLISHAESVVAPGQTRHTVHPLVKDLEASNYLLDLKATSTLVAPHGGNLVNRFLREPYDHSYLKSLNRVVLDQKSQMEVEQLATGTYSPLEGFMTKIDFHCVLSDMRLSDGTVWPIPIVLDVSKEVAETLCVGEQVALVDSEGDVVALLHLEEKYSFDKGKAAIQLYGTDSDQHPGVQMMMAMNPILLAGKLDLVKRRSSVTKEYELSPKQVRRLFEERGWTHVLGFHTRNVIHRAHEFIQRSAIESENCDGLFVHPVVGGKKPGDFATKYIVQSYVTMLENFYPSDKVVLAAFSTFSRYAGPREALFTALCRKNFGCSHFIVGRDHTGVSNYYDPDASHKVFDQFPDIGIKVVKFEEVFYSKSAKDYVHKTGDSYREEDRLAISGSTARQMFERKEAPPSWFMRPEISEMILQAINNGEQVFVDMD
ncbi:MAG: sulfate adenylyltransferase, partial [Gammaproteobacteria bacterium]|nr:sulfate adenylyltransferase [Gammaproteobacteria bacterium]